MSVSLVTPGEKLFSIKEENVAETLQEPCIKSKIKNLAKRYFKGSADRVLQTIHLVKQGDTKALNHLKKGVFDPAVFAEILHQAAGSDSEPLKQQAEKLRELYFQEQAFTSVFWPNKDLTCIPSQRVYALLKGLTFSDSTNYVSLIYLKALIEYLGESKFNYLYQNREVRFSFEEGQNADFLEFFLNRKILTKKIIEQLLSQNPTEVEEKVQHKYEGAQFLIYGAFHVQHQLDPSVSGFGHQCIYQGKGRFSVFTGREDLSNATIQAIKIAMLKTLQRDPIPTDALYGKASAFCTMSVSSGPKIDDLRTKVRSWKSLEESEIKYAGRLQSLAFFLDLDFLKNLKNADTNEDALALFSEREENLKIRKLHPIPDEEKNIIQTYQAYVDKTHQSYELEQSLQLLPLLEECESCEADLKAALTEFRAVLGLGDKTS